MIHQDKVRTMINLAIFEKKQGKKDLNTASYEKKDYIRFEMLKTAVYTTIAYVMILGFIVLWNMETLIEQFDSLNYEKLLSAVILGYVFIMVFYLILTYRQSKEEYNHAYPRVRRYKKRLDEIDAYYAKEELEQRRFEKGQRDNG